MPISPVPNGHRLDAKLRALRGARASNCVCIALRVGLRRGRQTAVATKVIDLAKDGERDPTFCATSLKDVRPLSTKSSESPHGVTVGRRGSTRRRRLRLMFKLRSTQASILEMADYRESM